MLLKTILLLQAVIRIYASSNGIYGVPKIRSLLIRQGFSCSISSVSRAMATLGIKSIVSKKFTKKYSKITKEERFLIDNIIKDFPLSSINQIWTTDITFINTIYDGTFYLISFIDLFSRRVLSWDLFDNQKTDKVLSVLQKALSFRNPTPGLIVHSDKGPQMRSHHYRLFLSTHHFIFSHTSIDHSCDENAHQESFHASLKKEAIYQKKLYTFHDAHKVIFDYIEGFYNPYRPHSSLGYLSPIEFENSLLSSQPPLNSV